MRLPPNTAVGRYRVDAYINAGGMQEVYRATDTLLGRTVALKRPKNDDGERRFDRSARLSAQISQANVARTLDYFHDGDQAYLVEEFVEGIDLGVLMKRVPQLDPYMAAQILHGLAKGIASVHAVGVVHRDLKPSNVMAVGGFNLSDVKVTDFGVAHVSAAEIDASVAGGMLTLTGSKTLIGHLPYLAPEILRRKTTVDPAADIWALGALAFHFIAGFPPFGYELAEAVTQIMTAAVPPMPGTVRSHPQLKGLGQEIYGIAVACLQREPRSRPSASELVGLCERLCYPVKQREIGVVTGYPGRSFGFADSPGGTVFFHVDSVLGPRPSVGSEIWFARYEGDPRDRAHPVVAVLPPEKQ